MDPRTRIYGAVAGTVGLFLCIQLGALALVEPFVAAEAQPVEDPTDPSNSLLFFGVILVGTVLMLAAIKYDLERLIRGFVVLASGFIGWLVLDTLARPLRFVDTGTGSLDLALGWAGFLLPLALALAIVAGLTFHPEWYVIDAAGVVLGAGAAGLFGIAFSPFPALVFLVILAVYDAISVYGTEHMLTLADGVMDLNVPVLLVVPTTLSFSMLDDSGPKSGLSRNDSDDTDEPVDAEGDTGSKADSVDNSLEASTTDDTELPDSEDPQAVTQSEEARTDADEEPVRDALFIGLGDAVMPTILVASAAFFMQDAAPSLGVPGLAMNLPALTAMIGTLAGLVVLLWLVLKGRAHAGLPLLNGGAIGGYLVGAWMAGIPLVEAVGVPI